MSRNMHQTTTSRCVTLCALLLALLACSGAGANSLSTHTDPTERAFRIGLPVGWSNQMGIRRTNDEFQIPRNWITSNSPDGQTQWFIGDTNVPFFMHEIPRQQLAMMGMPEQEALRYMQQFIRQKGIVVMPFQSSAAFARDYANRRHGQQPGFRITGSRRSPELERSIAEQQQKLGVPQTPSDCAIVSFTYNQNGAALSGEIWATTSRDPGDPNMWSADVSGFVTKGELASNAKLFMQAALSFEISPKWMQREQQMSAQRMAANQQRMQQQQQQMNQGHQQHMAQLRNSHNAHMNRMANNSAAMDQQHQSWMNNQNSNYQQHQSFVRGINDQTLVNSGGTSYEVDAGSNNYYVDPNNNQYFGTDQQLNPGQVPDGYYEAEESTGSW